MKPKMKARFLKVALFLIGLVFILGPYTFMIIWPSGWRWQPNQPEYEQMIVGIYATLGVFLVLAARDPMRHLSLIWFTVWSSFVHGAVMGVQALIDPAERGHLLGDVPALLIVAAVLTALTPRREVMKVEEAPPATEARPAERAA